MSFNAGKFSVFKIANASAVLQNITTYLTSIDFSESIDELETTTLGSINRSYVLSFGDCEIDLEGIWDPTLDAIFAGLSAGFRAVPATVTNAAWEYGPAGLTAGLVKISGGSVLTEYNRPTKFDDLATWSAKLHVSGNITVGVWP